ncbi:MAG: hypothetical protein EOP51_10015 [Sphingobacteriales bacterium]|nr:MAG: hypothetical protein EOP51_10015 [Sphingobacteriales bacterium]
MRYILVSAITLLLLGSCKKKETVQGNPYSGTKNRELCLTDCIEAGFTPAYLYYDSVALDTVVFNTYKPGNSFKASSLVKSEVLYEEKIDQSKILMHRDNDFEIIVDHTDTFRISKITSTPTQQMLVCFREVCYDYPTYIEVNGQPGDMRGHKETNFTVFLKKPQ